MKKSFIFGLFAAALALVSCNSTDGVDTSRQDGMSLNFFAMPPVEANSRAALTQDGEDLKFAYSVGDKVTVTNSENKSYEFTLEEGDKGFVCKDAKPTEKAAKWTAYFPSTSISLANQSGTLADLAKYYLLMGTQDGITGAEGLDIKMNAQCAVLVINNQKGNIDINVKRSATSWVDAIITDPNLGVGISTQSKEVSLLKTDKKDTYYVVVPAGKQIAIKDGDKVIKSTKEAGLTAGCFHNITVQEAPATLVTSINLDYPTIIPIGHYSSNMSRVYPVDATNKELEWSSSNTAVATVDQTGKVTGVAAGTATITATAKDGSGKTATRNITVKEITTVQLWADGPKFATENARYNDNSDEGQSWQWAMDAWGDAWSLPTVEQWNALFTTDKVTKEWVEDPNNSGKYGFKFTGKDSYSGVSLFLPARNGYASIGNAHYWSVDTDGAELAKFVYLDCSSSVNFHCEPNSTDRTLWCLVRLVLKN